ncbi:MAG: DUF3341 domain-containing protein [Acidobacteria bacterium]|nr:DUF3341 domain-containing protein [Acidobacteriota bacterium]MBI3280059.1 DUF3341 domain-containing protein [Acidobacteriota bacterium]
MNHENGNEPAVYGLLAEFDTPDQLLAATRAAYDAGFRKIDAYSPLPVHGLAEAVGFHKTRVSLVVLIGALCGAAFGYGLQYFMVALSYVHNVGGRPIHSWPSFIPVTFETSVLFASIFAVVGMLAMNGLPKPYNALFNAPRFGLASDDRFFLCIESRDPKFELDGTREFLESLNAYEVTVVHD